MGWRFVRHLLALHQSPALSVLSNFENGKIIKMLRMWTYAHNDQTKETVVIRYTCTTCNKTLILYYNSVQMINPDSRLNLNSWTLQTSKVICNPSARKHVRHRAWLQKRIRRPRTMR